MSFASEYDRAEQVAADVALLQDMAAGRLDEQRVVQAAQVLLEHRRHELPSVSVAVTARPGVRLAGEEVSGICRLDYTARGVS